ncbi:hypothetical protein LAB1_35940 [Roseibium sp. LAB1]
MFRLSQTKSGCATHQQNLGFSLRSLIASLFARTATRTRKRLNVAHLPEDLRRDIGLDPNPHETSFEARWQKELKDLQR